MNKQRETVCFSFFIFGKNAASHAILHRNNTYMKILLLTGACVLLCATTHSQKCLPAGYKKKQDWMLRNPRSDSLEQIMFSVRNNRTYQLCLAYENGTVFSAPFPVRGKGWYMKTIVGTGIIFWSERKVLTFDTKRKQFSKALRRKVPNDNDIHY